MQIKLNFKYFIIFYFILVVTKIKAQFTIDTTNNAIALATRIVGPCNTVLSASLNAGAEAVGTFTYSGTNVGINSGIVLTTGLASDIANPASYGCSNANGNPFSDPDLTAIVANARFDVAILEFVFQVNDPNTKTITFNSIFGSEEYPFYVGSSYNDVLKIFISGPMPCGGNYVKQNISNVTINTYNAGSNSSQFVQNYNLNYPDIAWGGYTTKISNTFSVVPCQTYTVKIAIADAGDPALDSGVLIEDAISPCPPIIYTATSVSDTCGKGNGTVVITKPNDDCHHSYIINWPNQGTVGTTTINTPGSNGNNSVAISGVPAGTYSANIQLTLVPCGLVYNYPISVVVNNTGLSPVADFSVTPGCTFTNSFFTDLSVGLSPTDPINLWAWDFDNDNTVDNTQQNPSNIFISSATYSVNLLITSVSGCRASITKTITLNPNPVPSFTNSNICINSVVNLNSTSTISSPAIITSYSWDFGVGATPSTSSTQNPSTTYNSSGIKTITLSLISNQTCSATITQTLEVYPLPVANFSATSVCQGTATAYTDMSTPTGSIISWAWDFTNNGSVDNTTNTPTNLFSSSGTPTTNLVVTDNYGCKDTISLPVNVWGHTVPDFTSNNVCFGAASIFTNLTNESVNPNTGAGSTYVWDFADNSGTTTIVNPSHIYTLGGNGNATYNVTLTATSLHNCVDVIVKPVSVYAIPTASFTSDSVCLGTLSHMTDVSNGNGNAVNDYMWDFSNDGIVDVTGVANPNYVFPSIGNNNVSYTVSTSPVTGLVCVNITNTIQVWVNPLPVPNFTFVNKCINAQPNTFNGGSSTIAIGTNTAYTWAYGDGMLSLPTTVSTSTHTYAAAGVYNVTLTLTSNKGCQNTITNAVEVYEKPNMLIKNSTPCDQSAMTFSATQQTGSGIVTNWYWDFNNSIASTEGTGQNPSFIFAGPGDYTIHLVSETNHGCRDTLQQGVYVNYLPQPNFTVNNADGCPKHCVTFTDMTPMIPGPGQLSRWTWSLGDGNNPTVNNTNATVDHCYINNSSNQLAQYSVQLMVTTTAGCSVTVTKSNYITVYPKPIAQYEANTNPSNVLEPLIYFTNQSIDYTKWWWMFGDGSSLDSTRVDPEHFYNDATSQTYYSLLLVANQYGCLDTAYLPVEVSPAFTFYIPNAFTPNDDGINDYFNGTGIGIAAYEMWVFDRWGERVFYTDDIKKGWDGRVQGKSGEEKQDVYIWKVNIKDVLGKGHFFTGHVTLLR